MKKFEPHLKALVVQIVLIAMVAVAAEFGLRLLKSYLRDGGTVVLRRSSINSQSDPDYGWYAPRGEEIEYSRACYGSIKATYNENGQRLSYLPKKDKDDGLKRVCVVGDSTSQAYQVTDGTTYYHVLQNRIDPSRKKVEILPMAVGGFGTLQEVMLLKEWCMPYQPDLIIWQLDANDLTNNLFEREYFAGSNNNFRKRPYWEQGKIVFRRPMLLPDWVDSVALRLVNAVVSGWLADPDRAERVTAKAQQATQAILRDFLGPVNVPVLTFFSGAPDETVRSAFKERGFEEVLMPQMTEDLNCAKAGDTHRNSKGHEQIATEIEPHIRRLLDLVQ
jgi:hypothetical protein